MATMNGSVKTNSSEGNSVNNGVRNGVTNDGDTGATSTTTSNSSNNNNNNDNDNDNNRNPRIRRRNWFGLGSAHAGGASSRDMGDSRHSSSNNNNNNNSGRNSSMSDYMGPVKRLVSIADYQDGKRHNGALETTSILHDTAEVFQNVSTRIGLSQKHNNQDHRAKMKAMNLVRLKVGLYQNFPLANAILNGSDKRETALRKSGHKQMNHVRGTDGWWRSIMVLEDRAMDNYLGPWILILLNALFACLLTMVADVDLPQELLEHWDTVYSMVLKTSLAFLLVFRLNRCAMRYWEARGLWGNLTHATRNLVGALLLYGSHSPKHRDSAIQWGSAFCVASKNFIRSDHFYDPQEFSGFLTPSQVARLRDSNHPPLFAASMCRHHLSKAFPLYDSAVMANPGLMHAHAIRLRDCETHVCKLVEQVSGMEKIRSTPLPIAYVAHLRTFLMAYCLFLPYVWVGEWEWFTIPLTGFTAFALLGIEGASSEVEIPFSQTRPNHLALDAYCLVILDSVLGMVVHDANMHMQGRKGSRNSIIRNLSFDGDSDDDEDDENDNNNDNNNNKGDGDEYCSEEIDHRLTRLAPTKRTENYLPV